MNYLIPTFDCVLFDFESVPLFANVKYKIENISQNKGVIFSNNSIPFVLDFENPNSHLLKVMDERDSYFFVFPNSYGTFFTTKFNYKAYEVIISLSNSLVVSINGELICEKNVENLKYSHFEIIGELCLIYFEGKRNFVVVLKDREVCFASYYDECNITSDEKYFMCRLNDSLNHGRVCCIKDKKFNSYLVYLDDEAMLTKNEFVPFIFLDCVKAENYKHANSLLCEDLKLKDEKMIDNFFPKFNYFYPISNTKFILLNKNTLAGICEFFVDNCEILNITNHQTSF